MCRADEECVVCFAHTKYDFGHVGVGGKREGTPGTARSIYPRTVTSRHQGATDSRTNFVAYLSVRLLEGSSD
jgi:hypothetical protein